MAEQKKDTYTVKAHMHACYEYEQDIEVEVPYGVIPEVISSLLGEEANACFSDVCRLYQGQEPDITIAIDVVQGTPIEAPMHDQQTCTHSNATIAVVEEKYTDYIFVDGRIDYADEDDNTNVTDGVKFSCPDCLLVGSESDYRNAPPAIRALYEQIMKQEYDCDMEPHQEKEEPQTL